MSVHSTGRQILPLGFRNLLINGNFAINQRGYASGGTLGAGAFGHDRWCDTGGGGAKYTFTQTVPDTMVTVSAGAIRQVVEAANVGGGAYVLSWIGGGQMGIYVTPPGGSQALAASGTSPLVVPNIQAGSSILVATLGSGGSYGLIQLEAGMAPTPFERRPPAIELENCQRYYEQGFFTVTGSAYAANCFVGSNVVFKVSKRAAATFVATGTAYTNAQSGSFDGDMINQFRAYAVSTAAATNVQFLGFWSASAEL